MTRFTAVPDATLYMCGHGGWQLRRADGRPGTVTFLGNQVTADTLVTWLNERDLPDVRLTYARQLRCGHHEFWLHQGDDPAGVTFDEASADAAARLADWVNRQLRHDTGATDA